MIVDSIMFKELENSNPLKPLLMGVNELIFGLRIAVICLILHL